MASPLDLYSFVSGEYDAGRKQRDGNRLKALYQQALSDPSQNQRAIIGQVAAIDPSQAQGLYNLLNSRAEDQRKAVGQRAAMVRALPQEQRQAAYEGIRPDLDAAGLFAPEGADEGYLGAVAQTYGGAGSNSNTVQSRFVGEDGQVYALMRDGSVSPLGIKADPNTQIIEGAGGFYGVDKRTLGATPVQVGRPAAPQRAPGEVPFSIDPSLPPEVQASIRANESQWASKPHVNIGDDLSNIPPLSTFTGGGQLQAAPKAGPQQTDIERRLQMARQMGATPEELKRMVVGGDSGRDAQRISTADATKARQKMTQIQSARQQLNAVKQAFQKLRGSFSAGIGGNYLPPTQILAPRIARIGFSLNF